MGGMGGGMGGGGPAPMSFTGGPMTYESVVQQTPAYNTTVYVGNLVPFCTQADLIPLFQSIGYLSEVRMQADRGFAFVKLDTHEHAAMAIVQLQGQMVHGRPIKCSWGKDRDTGATGTTPISPVASSPYGSMVRCLCCLRSFLLLMNTYSPCMACLPPTRMASTVTPAMVPVPLVLRPACRKRLLRKRVPMRLVPVRRIPGLM